METRSANLKQVFSLGRGILAGLQEFEEEPGHDPPKFRSRSRREGTKTTPIDPHPEESNDSSEGNDGTSTKIPKEIFHAFSIHYTRDEKDIREYEGGDLEGQRTRKTPLGGIRESLHRRRSKLLRKIIETGSGSPQPHQPR